MFMTDSEATTFVGLILLNIILTIGACFLAKRYNRIVEGWAVGTVFFGVVSFFFLLCCGKKQTVSQP